MSDHVLITGGAGFIGSHLADALLATGHEVRIFDNLEPQVHGKLGESGTRPDYLDPEAEFVFGDIRDPEGISHALEDIDVVFHLAALVGIGQSMYEIARYTLGNTYGAAALLQAVVNAKKRPRKLVVASSMSIYGEGSYVCQAHGTVHPKLRSISQLQRQEWEMLCPVQGCRQQVSPCPTSEEKPLYPTSIYAINKRDHEEMFMAVGQAYGIPTVALRYFNTYGTRQALSNPYTGVAAIFSNRLINRKSPVIFEDGWQQRDFVHVSDIAQANLLVMQDPRADFGVFNVGSGRAFSIRQVAQALLEHFEKSNPRLDMQTFSPEITQQFRAGDIRHCFSDISRLMSLGYKPRVTFERGVEELFEWVRSQDSTDHFEAARSELKNRGLAI
ncbi:MAG: nucleoside-diphosphate-sugar epimerase [Chloroflexi bacterium RBG_16_54_18]|nr:MAG: nucleoside-diphosphate-sugar epimerase [Chloroflexi bacterium RBG_16_54_18]